MSGDATHAAARGGPRDVLIDAVVLFRREMLRYRRERAYWAGQILFPLVVVGFIGFGLNEVVVLPSGGTYAAHLATGILALLVGSAGVGAGYTLIQDRDSGFLRPLWIAPISRASIVLGKLAARLLASILLLAVLVGALGLVTDLAVPHPLAALVATAAVTTLFVALGVTLGSSLRSAESFRLLAALVTVPVYFLSGIFYPVETLPLAMRVLAYLNPLTYAVDLLRLGLLAEHELPILASVALLLVGSAAALWAAVRVFASRAEP